MRGSKILSVWTNSWRRDWMKTAEHRTNHWSERVPDHKLGFNSPMRESRYLRHFDVHLETVQSSSNKPKLLPSLWLCKQWRTRKNININWSRVSISILWRFFYFYFYFSCSAFSFPSSPQSFEERWPGGGQCRNTRIKLARRNRRPKHKKIRNDSRAVGLERQESA